MREIGTLGTQQEKSKNTARNFTIFLLALLILSSLGYAFLSNPDTTSDIPVNGETGVRQVGDRWVFGQAGREISLLFSPAETADIPVGILNGLESYVGVPLFLDITNPGISNEIGAPMQLYASRIQGACYGACESDLPEKNCSENLVVWRNSNTSSVRQEERCVFIEGDLRAADAYIYTLFNIPRENL